MFFDQITVTSSSLLVAQNILSPSFIQRVQHNLTQLDSYTDPPSWIASPLPRALHWMPVENSIQYNRPLLCFKSLQDLAPRYVLDLLHLYTPSRRLRSSSDARLFRIPSFRSKNNWTFAHQASSAWNSLPFTERHAPSLQLFQPSLKSSLFVLALNKPTLWSIMHSFVIIVFSSSSSFSQPTTSVSHFCVFMSSSPTIRFRW